MRSWSGFRIVMAATVLGVLVATPCMAQSSPSEKALAEALFREARDLMKQNKAAAACSKFQESQRLDPKLGTLLNLAVCHETLGLTASAWAEFNEAQHQAERSNELDRQSMARERASALESKLSHLTIVVPAPTEGLEVRARKRTVGAPVFGVPLPFDPGPVLIVASAKGHKEWSTTISLPPGPVSLTVEIPALEPVIAAPPAPPGVSLVAPPPSPSGSRSTSRALGWAALGLGAAGAAAGTFFGLRTFSQRNDAEVFCAGRFCSQEGLDLHDDARASATLSTVTFALGGAALAAGLVLILTSSSRASGVATRPAESVVLGGLW